MSSVFDWVLLLSLSQSFDIPPYIGSSSCRQSGQLEIGTILGLVLLGCRKAILVDVNNATRMR
jgi:hypothetical protein